MTNVRVAVMLATVVFPSSEILPMPLIEAAEVFDELKVSTVEPPEATVLGVPTMTQAGVGYTTGGVYGVGFEWLLETVPPPLELLPQLPQPSPPLPVIYACATSTCGMA